MSTRTWSIGDKLDYERLPCYDCRPTMQPGAGQTSSGGCGPTIRRPFVPLPPPPPLLLVVELVSQSRPGTLPIGTQLAELSSVTVNTWAEGQAARMTSPVRSTGSSSVCVALRTTTAEYIQCSSIHTRLSIGNSTNTGTICSRH